MTEAENSGTNALSRLSSASSTMFITLAARASASKHAQDTGFSDPYASSILGRLPQDLSSYASDHLLVRSVVIRARLFDELAADFIGKNQACLCINLGCGLCSRGQRLGRALEPSAGFTWYDLDLPAVIEIRSRFADILTGDKAIACTLTDLGWLDKIGCVTDRPLLLIMEGVAPYLQQREIEMFISALAEKLNAIHVRATLLIDFVHPLLTGEDWYFAMPGINDAVFVSGFACAKTIESLHPSLRVTAEHHVVIEKISSKHADFNRDFHARTGEWPYTVAELRFEYCERRNLPESKAAKTKKINWHPRYFPLLLSPTSVMLVSETTPLLLEGEEYRTFLSQIDGSKTKEEIVLSLSDFQSQARMLYTIDTLVDRGLILESDEGDTRYATPDFSVEPLDYASGENKLIILSGYRDADVFMRWFDRLGLLTRLSVVIADDYLDPRLLRLNARFAKEKKPWVLIKSTGTQSLIGPYFVPGKGPCMRCLASAMLRNQPVRKWLEEMKNQPSVPVRYEENAIIAFLSLVAEKIPIMIDNNLTSVLWSVDEGESVLRQHAVTKRPQCGNCGDPDLVRRRAGARIELRPSPRVCCNDGGYRTRNPAQTCERVMQFVSPVSGIINDISPLPGWGNDGIPIYRSSYFRTPTRNAHPRYEDFFQVSLGKGITIEQSMASALSESVERYAAHYEGDEHVCVEKASELDAPAIFPEDLVFYSAAQAESGFITRRIDPGQPYPWTPCRSLSNGTKKYVPFTYCYYNTPFDNDAVVRFGSNGCAAGNTMEEAMLQGFLELVERDAVAVWWYNRVRRPRANERELDEAVLRPVRASLGREWEYWVLDITHDFRIPVRAAIGRNKAGERFAMGFGCHPHASIASGRALTELCQLVAIGHKSPRGFDFARIVPEPYLFPSPDKDVAMPLPETPAETSDIADDIRFCVERAAEHGFETLVHDYTRPDLPLATVRVIIPGLCHMWPQLANPRLYDVPVKIGWLNVRLSESSLNPIGLFL